ncbi:MAG: hypothetical protein KIT84_05205 [Labilithrix sp.]|nr:hypothetical protein [Labilithrix sp.]MCW5810384.1 hypothetical protein [Labilithrix sp.]
MRLLGHTLTATAIATLALLVAPACADNDQSIFIRQALAPSVNRQGGACVYTGDPQQPALFEGVVDVAVRDNYSAILLVGNQMIQRGDPLAARTEPNRAKITGAIVRVTDANGNSLGEFTSLSQGFVDAATGAVPSFGPIQIIAIDAPTMSRIANGLAPGQTRLILANIRAFGESLGGVDLETDEYQLPIRVCNRCLISFLTGDDPLTPGIDCNRQTTTGGTGGTGGGAEAEPPCSAGQDEVVPCEFCQDREACKGG